MDARVRRVVITGIGAVTPCGTGARVLFQNLLEGRSGIGPIRSFDATRFSTRIAAEVRDFELERFVPHPPVRALDRFVEFALAASALAMQDGQVELTDKEREDAACYMGVAFGGLATLERSEQQLLEKGPERIRPFALPSMVPNMAAGQVSIAHGLRGPSCCVSLACASGAAAIGEATLAVAQGRASMALAGGCEATVTPLGVSGFQAMRALSRRNDDPEHASRPFDRGRDGFVLGEGAAVLVLEPLERARQRGARIYAEVSGYGASNDAHHIVQPAPDGHGARACMHKALQSAGVEPASIDYVNAHATATLVGDTHECNAILEVFGSHAADGHLWVSSTKSMTGHMIGAAGAVEAAVCAMACERGQVPPTINVEDQDPECRLDVVPNEARERPVRHALSNSFGFGGANASLVLSAVA